MKKKHLNDVVIFDLGFFISTFKETLLVVMSKFHVFTMNGSQVTHFKY